MAKFYALLCLSLAVSDALASPFQIRSSPVTLSIARKVNCTGGARALLDRDQARARVLLTRGRAKAQGFSAAEVSLPVTDVGQIYTASIGVGASTYNLAVDTGSSNTWIGAGKRYQPGPNSRDTGQSVNVSYGSGNFSGEEYLDDVRIGSATILRQSIGVASKSVGFDGFDGILGIGPVDLTEGTTSGGSTVPTVTDNMVSQGLIEAPLVGISFVPTTSSEQDINGELSFGRPDNTKFTGKVYYFPITGTSPANQFWGIDQSITYGQAGIPILSTTAGIVDTGTTLVLLASDAFQTYMRETGATPDKATGLLTVSDPSTLQSLFFNIGPITFEFTPNAQMWPRKLNSDIGGTANATYLIVGDLGTPSGQGLDFVNGFSFLQRFYSVYVHNILNSEVGLAVTSHTYDTSN